jgi:hypothetical protein
VQTPGDAARIPSGLTGSRQLIAHTAFVALAPGWWGQAFFGTQMTSAGFITAWCTGMQRDAATLSGECYPTGTSR